MEPLKAYFGQYKERFQQLAENYFDELVRASGVSAEENAATVAEHAKALAQKNDADKTAGKHRGLMVFLIVVSVLLALGGIITCIAFVGTEQVWIGILTISLCVAAAVALIVVMCVVINKRIKQADAVAESFQKEADRLEALAWQQMSPLNAKYDWGIPDELVYQTVPHIRTDKFFDEDKLAYFDEHCKLGVHDDASSAVCVKSGNSDGHPYMLARFLRQSMEPHSYVGTRVVTWTETERDASGHTRVVTHSETLMATVVRPKPEYRHVTYLFYGCDAAPDLHFDRQPTVPADADERKIHNMVKKGEKELEKKAREAVNRGESYNKLANSEFEVLFDASNRDHEVQFRMMFTPLAQQNMVELLKSKQAYGDDFYFYKMGAVNVIRSAHAANTDIDAAPNNYVDFNLERARKHFVEFNCEYFRSLYFDFAPLFSVPLYTQDVPERKYELCTKPGNIGDWEAETVANRFDDKLLAHPSTATALILKAQTTVGEHSTVAHVTAHSFEAIPQIAYVPVLCRNGHTYEVPVPWMLYEPLQRETDIVMQYTGQTREQFQISGEAGAVFAGGISAKLC